MNNLQFSLIKYRVFKVFFQILERKDLPPNAKYDPEFATDYSVSPDNEKMLEVLFAARVKQGAGLPFEIEVIVQAMFQFSGRINSIPKNDLDKIARINCNAIIFPFVREAIAETTRKGGYNPLILPTMNFLEIYKKNSQQEITQS